MSEKEVLQRFNLPCHEELDASKALIAIMHKLLEIEEQLDRLANPPL